MIKSLHARQHALSQQAQQVALLEAGGLPSFKEKIKTTGFWPLRSSSIEIFQVNVGYMCNQVCKHCHVDAGPDRKEIMSRETMQLCLEVLKKSNIKTLDITGGAPELNPHFRWFVEEASALGVSEIIVRSNLTIILSNPSYHDLPEFFKQHKVRVVSSLPFYDSGKTDRQRGDGVFAKSIEALTMLNEVGYGKKDSGLFLDLVYNPTGAFLPGDQLQLERDFKSALEKNFGIHFNHLFTITNTPVSRFLDFLIATENYDDYMEKLVNAFNPAAVAGLMCTNTLSIGWQGYLYDCDFNQMLGLKVEQSVPQHLADFDLEQLSGRKIITGQHCYACTAGAGSSCQGTTV